MNQPWKFVGQVNMPKLGRKKRKLSCSKDTEFYLQLLKPNGSLATVISVVKGPDQAYAVFKSYNPPAGHKKQLVVFNPRKTVVSRA